MSIEDLRRMDTRIKSRTQPMKWYEYSMGTQFPKSKPRWKETSTPVSRGVSFNVGNFKRNSKRVIGGLQRARTKLGEFGDKYPNIRDPSWMLEDEPFRNKRRRKK